MVLGGVGLVIAAIVFFAWRKSTKGWQRTVAWIAAAWAVVSILFYIVFASSGGY